MIHAIFLMSNPSALVLSESHWWPDLMFHLYTFNRMAMVQHNSISLECCDSLFFWCHQLASHSYSRIAPVSNRGYRKESRAPITCLYENARAFVWAQFICVDSGHFTQPDLTHHTTIWVFCPFVWLFVRDLLRHLQTDRHQNATFLSFWASESQAGNPIGSALVICNVICLWPDLPKEWPAFIVVVGLVVATESTKRMDWIWFRADINGNWNTFFGIVYLAMFTENLFQLQWAKLPEKGD